MNILKAGVEMESQLLEGVHEVLVQLLLKKLLRM